MRLHYPKIKTTKFYYSLLITFLCITYSNTVYGQQDLISAFNRARGLAKGIQIDSDARHGSILRERERSTINRNKSKPPKKVTKPSQREIKKEKIKKYLNYLDNQLELASLKTPITKPVLNNFQTPEKVRSREIKLISLLKKASNDTYNIVINPTTTKGSVKNIDVNRERRQRASRRKAAIINGTSEIIQLQDNPNAKSYEYPWYYKTHLSKKAAKSVYVDMAAREYGLDPDLIRAIIWMETSHGWYDQVLPLDKRKSVLPMNIYVDYWKELGITQKSMNNMYENIKVGARILKELSNRIENPNIEKIATLYGNLGEKQVSGYGKTVSFYYKAKPWKKQ